jgi:predicted nucleic acid-binding Zn ribbon protein
MAELSDALSPDTPLARVQRLWPTVAEALPVAQEATPTTLNNGVLTVACTAAVYAQEIALMSVEVVSAVNGAAREPLVRDLRVRTV